MQLIALIIALVVCISVHEAAHAWVAWKLGDPTAKHAGRVTLNPKAHLDVLGTLMIFIAHFGWGKPVPYNDNNLKHPRRDAALISLAGPASNLLTALVIAFLIKYLPISGFLFLVLQSIFALSIILMLFNLLPIAPLDGSKFVGAFIPESKQNWYESFVHQGPIWIILIIVGDRLINEIVGFSFLGTYLQYGYDFVQAGIFLIT